jgi:excisionase family DNA binding protein
MTERLVTAREVADMLGVSSETVLRWQRQRKLPAIRLPGGAIRFRQAELEVWLESRATPERGVSPTPQDAAPWQPTAPGSTLGTVTHPSSEED